MSEAGRELANLTERKNLHTNVYMRAWSSYARYDIGNHCNCQINAPGEQVGKKVQSCVLCISVDQYNNVQKGKGCQMARKDLIFCKQAYVLEE